MKSTAQEFLKIIIFPVMFPLSWFIFRHIIGIYGLPTGFLLSYMAYWAIILFISFYFLAYTGVNELFRFHWSGKLFWGVAALIPAFAVFFVFFLPVFIKIRFPLLLMAIIAGIINSYCEELFWRGLTMKTTVKYKKAVIISSVIGFGLWHVTLATISGLKLPGGVYLFCVGLFLLGILWQFIAYKMNNLIFVTLAHVLVSITVYTTLIYQNWQ